MDPRPVNFQYRRQRPQNRTFLSYGTGNSLYYLGLANKQPPSNRYMRMQSHLAPNSVRTYNNPNMNQNGNVNNYFPDQQAQFRENINSISSKDQNIGQQYKYQNNNYQNQLERQLINKDRMFSSVNMKPSAIQRNQSMDINYPSNQYQDRYSPNPASYQNINYAPIRVSNQPQSHDAVTNYQRDRSYSSQLSNYGTNIMKTPVIDQNRIYEKQQKQYNIITCFPRQVQPKLKQFPKFTLEHTQYKKGPYQLNSE